MPDIPQSPNSSRIQSMLNDLAQQRQQGAPSAAQNRPPPNLPTPPPPTPVVASPPAAAVVPPAPSRPTPPPVTTPPPATPPMPPAPRPAAPPAPPVAMPPPMMPVPKPAAPMPAVIAPLPKPPVTQIMPQKPAPSAPVTPSMPAPVAFVPPPKPAAPAAASPNTPPAKYSVELRTMNADIGSIRVGQTPQGARTAPPVVVPPPTPVAPAVPAVPGAPAAPRAPMPSGGATIQTQSPTMATPTSGGSGRGRLILMVGLGVVVVGIVIAIGTSLLSSSSTATPSPSVVATATETPTPTATPAGKNLQTYFGVPSGTAVFSNAGSAVNDFRNLLATLTPAARQALSVSPQWQGGTALAAADFLQTMFPNTPIGAISSSSDPANPEYGVYAYGQTEIFDATGQKNPSATTQVRPFFVVEVKDATKINQAMQAWEGTTFISSAKVAFALDTTKQLVPGFSSGTYRQIPIRYANFSYADRSLDWAMVLATNGKNYLIVANSRESIFFAIDQLSQQ